MSLFHRYLKTCPCDKTLPYRVFSMTTPAEKYFEIENINFEFCYGFVYISENDGTINKVYTHRSLDTKYYRLTPEPKKTIKVAPYIRKYPEYKFWELSQTMYEDDASFLSDHRPHPKEYKRLSNLEVEVES